jgi:putative addiction module killer protein
LVILGRLSEFREELRIDQGPGHRIYFGKEGTTIVILLTGGSKKSQTRDIAKAKQYWLEYKELS